MLLVRQLWMAVQVAVDILLPGAHVRESGQHLQRLSMSVSWLLLLLFGPIGLMIAPVVLPETVAAAQRRQRRPVITLR